MSWVRRVSSPPPASVGFLIAWNKLHYSLLRCKQIEGDSVVSIDITSTPFTIADVDLTSVLLLINQ